MTKKGKKRLLDFRNNTSENFKSEESRKKIIEEQKKKKEKDGENADGEGSDSEKEKDPEELEML